MTKEEEVVAGLGNWPVCPRHIKRYDPGKNCPRCNLYCSLFAASIFTLIAGVALLVLTGLSAIVPTPTAAWMWLSALSLRGKLAAVSLLMIVTGFIAASVFEKKAE